MLCQNYAHQFLLSFLQLCTGFSYHLWIALIVLRRGSISRESLYSFGHQSTATSQNKKMVHAECWPPPLLLILRLSIFIYWGGDLDFSIFDIFLLNNGHVLLYHTHSSFFFMNCHVFFSCISKGRFSLIKPATKPGHRTLLSSSPTFPAVTDRAVIIS